MNTSIAARANLELIEENYRRWQENPQAVDSGWSAFFEGFELGNLPEPNGAVAQVEAGEAALQTRVDGLVYAYCSLGHTIARVNPLAETRPQNPLLSLDELGFTEADLDRRVSSKFFLDNQPMTLREMVAGLERIYADSIGSEFMHIQHPGCASGFASGWRAARTSTPRHVPCSWRCCACFWRRNRLRCSCILATWARKGFRFRARNL